MLNDDYELTREDIQDLSGRDALAAFFAKLGYDTNDRLVQNVAAMGFSSDNLKSAITHIERLASQDGRMSTFSNPYQNERYLKWIDELSAQRLASKVGPCVIPGERR